MTPVPPDVAVSFAPPSTSDTGTPTGRTKPAGQVGPVRVTAAVPATSVTAPATPDAGLMVSTGIDTPPDVAVMLPVTNGGFGDATIRPSHPPQSGRRLSAPTPATPHRRSGPGRSSRTRRRGRQRQSANW